MPLLCGDNPITNTLPSKFLRLTDMQFYLLRQWAIGMFFNEELRAGRAAIRGSRTPAAHRRRRASSIAACSQRPRRRVLPRRRGGLDHAQPAVYRVPYRIKADPGFYNFGQTAAHGQRLAGRRPGDATIRLHDERPEPGDDFGTGLQPGDLTKYMAVPWQADFNECSTQAIDITYEAWNKIYAASESDR